MSGASAPVLVVEGGYAGWRAQALRALAAGWPPEAVTWVERDAASSDASEQLALGDFTSGTAASDSRGAGQPDADPAHTGVVPDVRVSRELAALLKDAALYRSAERWPLLYRVLWRWSRGDRAVASPADEDGARLLAMAKAVRRAKHDMIAYVRFHRRGTGDSGGGERGATGESGAVPEYLAWYEPDHDVLADAAEHFADRMGASTWWIGTPDGAALWDGEALQFSTAPADAAAIRAGAAADQVESLWLAYYRSIFNPARLNEHALHQHMPVRFWKNLPEGPLIPAMVADARNGARRVGQAGTVGVMKGKQVAVDAARAQPPRAAPSSLDACRRCELWRHATQAVPGTGPETARIMLVGEQPGDHEDLSGCVFVGPAGQVLDDAMRRAGVARDSVYLTNAVKHFKWVARGKRRLHKTPGQQEVEACAHWLEQERTRVRPAVIVALGATALGAILHRKVSMRDYLDAPVRIGDTWLVATWHPSYALRVQQAGARETVVDAIGRAIARAHELATASTGPGS